MSERHQARRPISPLCGHRGADAAGSQEELKLKKINAGELSVAQSLKLHSVQVRRRSLLGQGAARLSRTPETGFRRMYGPRVEHTSDVCSTREHRSM